MSSNSNPTPNDLHVADNSFLPSKPKRNPLAFFSSLALFLLSISIVSISIFKNLSFSSLFNSTNFWFFISNILVLIIAADYGVNSKPERLDFYQERETPEEKLKIVVEGRDLRPPLKTPARTFRRSKSEKPKRSEERKKIMGRRSGSVKYEENEFEKMTDEELNRRVEEFIQRFNRQMRLQTRTEN